MEGLVTPLDSIDRRILKLLQEDGRLSNVDLADQVGLSPSPCLRRLRRLEQAGFIKRYAAVLDTEAVGLGVTAYVHISLERHDEATADRFEAMVRDMPEVTECYPVTGDDDYLLKVVASDLKAYSRFLMEDLMRQPGITNIKSSFVLGEIKSTTAVPLDAA